jgi:hypothetical protein
MDLPMPAASARSATESGCPSNDWNLPCPGRVVGWWGRGPEPQPIPKEEVRPVASHAQQAEPTRVSRRQVHTVDQARPAHRAGPSGQQRPHGATPDTGLWSRSRRLQRSPGPLMVDFTRCVRSAGIMRVL